MNKLNLVLLSWMVLECKNCIGVHLYKTLIGSIYNMVPHTAGKKQSTSHFRINGGKSMSLLVNWVQEFISLYNISENYYKFIGIFTRNCRAYTSMSENIHNNSVVVRHKHSISQPKAPCLKRKPE